MAESQTIRERFYAPSERARNERLVRLGQGRQEWGGNPYTRRAVNDMVEGIDFKNLSLAPHNDIGVKYNRYRVAADGKEYVLELLQPINRTNRRYDVTLMGGNEVEYLDALDLDRLTERQAKDRLRREMERYINRR